MLLCLVVGLTLLASFFLLSSGDSTPLMEAASGGYADIVKLLISHGANVNAKSRYIHVHVHVRTNRKYIHYNTCTILCMYNLYMCMYIQHKKSMCVFDL